MSEGLMSLILMGPMALSMVGIICPPVLSAWLAALLRRALARPLGWIGRRTGLNDTSTTGIIMGSITV